MINFVAPILAKVVADKFLGGEGSRVQTEKPPRLDLSGYKRRVQRIGPKYRSRMSQAAPVEGSTFQPISQYNAILRKQLGLLTSKT
jgi:hypothetical protein